MKDTLKLYTINADYVKYLSKINPHLYRDDKQRKRKYVGIVLHVRNFQYFVPLTSFKKKHKALADSLDFMKMKIIEHYRKHIAKYAMPYDFEFRDELPKTLVGKVAYTVLEKEEAGKKSAVFYEIRLISEIVSSQL